MTVDFVFTPPRQAAVPIAGGGYFPVRRIFCIGKNYGAHVAEMGGDPKSDPPVFFTKPADAIVNCPDDGNAIVPYPPGTNNLHFEGELVIALSGGGRQLKTRQEAGGLIFGQAVGCDLTRRDLQNSAKAHGGPWDTAKAFDHSAPLGSIGRITDFPPDLFDDVSLETRINGEQRQHAPLSEMIWSVPEIIIELSSLFDLYPGDLVFTGTPAGVGALQVGDRVEVSVGPLPKLSFAMGAPKDGGAVAEEELV